MDLIITILPVVTKDLPVSPRFTPYNFLSRCKFSTLTTRQPMVEFYSRSHAFRYERKNTNPTFGKNRTHDFRTIKQVCRLPTRPLGRRALLHDNLHGRENCSESKSSRNKLVGGGVICVPCPCLINGGENSNISPPSPHSIVERLG